MCNNNIMPFGIGGRGVSRPTNHSQHHLPTLRPKMATVLFMISLLLTIVSETAALHADEAGLTDFLLRTSGHGHYGVQYASPLALNDEVVWVTSESGPPGAIRDVEQTSRTGECFVSARNVTDGTVIWRVNACSSSSRGNSHAARVTGGMVHTIDNVGILRGWKVDSGLKWDVDVIAELSGQNEEKSDVFSIETPRLLSAETKQIIGTVATKGKEEFLLLHHSLTGEIIHSNDGDAALLAKQFSSTRAKSGSFARIIDMVSSKDSMGIISGHSSEKEIAISEMAFTEIELSSNADGQVAYKIINTVPIKVSAEISNTPLMLSSLQMWADGPKFYVLGIQKNGPNVIVANFDMGTGKGNGKSVSMNIIDPTMISLNSVSVDDSGNDSAGRRMVRIAGVGQSSSRLESLAILQEDGDGTISLEKISSKEGDHDVSIESLVYCPLMNVAVAASTVKSGTMVSSHGTSSDSINLSPRSIEGDRVLIPPSRGGTTGGLVQNAHLVECKADSMTAVFAARGGMTVALRLTTKGSSLSATQLWSTEEALGSISSAVFLDETHAISMSDDGSVNADDEEEKALQNLQFSNRLQSQVSSFKSFFFSGGILSSLASMALMSDEKKAERDFAFGFAKISVLLSESMNRIVALDTAKNGRVVWSMNLNPSGTSHKIVHGSQFVSLNDPHGYGGVHDHELLVLSSVPTAKPSLEWKCFDGMTGRVFAEDVVNVSSKVAQIVPLRSSVHHSSHVSGSCRQVALVVHEDRTVSVVPDTARSYATVDEAISAPGSIGLFVHTVDKQTGEFQAMRLSRKKDSVLKLGSKPFELVTVGTALFDPSQEKIVNVAYPQRGEVIQSPSTVLGDDALLLKYLNPHLAVVVTEATKSFLAEVAPASEGSNEDDNTFYKALSTSDGSSSPGQKRKPLGASKPGEAPPAATSTVTPSLFVTLIDSVSGQILHRVSHAHAAESDIAEDSPSEVPVIISENWVIYTFFNQRTRRTDVGVLTLHEGMIDKNGLTAFSGPDQELTFSSLESAKPIVLSKTYGIAKAITALGVTVTKAGITSKQVLFATGNDQVIAMDRRLMDPRRPGGELKPSEKMEGLVKYVIALCVSDYCSVPDYFCRVDVLTFTPFVPIHLYFRYAPLLPIIPLRTPSHVYEVSSVQSIASTAANVESQSLVLAFGGPDVFFSRLAPSKGFDLLPDDFNRGLLSLVLLGMTVVLVSMQQMNKKKMVTTVWS